MNINFKRIFIAVVLSISVLSLSSCFLAAVNFGGGTVAYINGEYSMNVQQNYTGIYKATIKAIKQDSSYMLISKELGDDSAEIDGVTKLKISNFTVSIHKVTTDISKVTIKFGSFGNQERSIRLMDKIQANVNTSRG